MKFIKKNVRRFVFASSGVLYATRTDYSFRIQIYVLGAVILGLIFLFSPLSYLELLFILLSYHIILITELQNSAFEAALDHLHPEIHNNIGKSKDMAAGAVLLAATFLIIVISTLLYVRIM